MVSLLLAPGTAPPHQVASTPASEGYSYYTMAPSQSQSHNYTMAMQEYMDLQIIRDEVCFSLQQLRPGHSGAFSSFSSPESSPTRSTSSRSSSSRRHSRSSERTRHHKAHARCSGWDDAADTLDTIPDEEMMEEISAEEGRLFEVNESIKRALTELLNCESVRGDRSMRLWVQSRLMETEKELRSGRRRRST